MTVPKSKRCLTAALALLLLGSAAAADGHLMIVGNDEKVVFTRKGLTWIEPGRDSLSVVDIGTDPANPRITATLKLDNSVIGPPCNLAIAPNGKLALVADSTRHMQEDATWKELPNNKLHVLDLSGTGPTLIKTLELGAQPSGLDINRAGTMALVTNRKGHTVSVLSIEGMKVNLVDTIDMGDEVTAVGIRPNSTMAVVAKRAASTVALLKIDGLKVTYDGVDIPVGINPYQVQVTPDGKLALSANVGTTTDGHADTISVIDLEADPPRVIDHVAVGDTPEGLAVSPDGRYAATAMIRGSVPHLAGQWFAHRNGTAVLLEIKGKRLRKVAEVEVGALPEGLVFSPDSAYLYVGNYIDRNISILKIESNRLLDTGRQLKMPGQPGSMRASYP